MAQVSQFGYGLVTPVLAFLLSYLGCLLGLLATARARRAERPARARWLVLGAWSIGGTGIWVMHFMAMIGFGVAGSGISYDVAVTIASWLAAVIVVGIGLFIVGYGRPSAWKILAAGVLTGVGVVAMHYSGVSAMHVNGTISFDRNLVIASVVIAVVAATVALWFTVAIRSVKWIVVAAGVMAVAVCGMHYTGMYAMRVHLHPEGSELTGVSALDFVLPIVGFVLAVIVVLGYALLAETTADDKPTPPAGRRVPPPSPVDGRASSWADSNKTAGRARW
jgi:NO-binding membrane sensor protein with MHYT domain